MGKHIHGFTLSEGKGAHTPSCQPPSGAGISQPLPPALVSKAVVTAVTPLRSGCLEGPGTGFLLGVLGRDLHSCTLPLYKKTVVSTCPVAHLPFAVTHPMPRQGVLLSLVAALLRHVYMVYHSPMQSIQFRGLLLIRQWLILAHLHYRALSLQLCCIPLCGCVRQENR